MVYGPNTSNKGYIWFVSLTESVVITSPSPVAFPDDGDCELLLRGPKQNKQAKPSLSSHLHQETPLTSASTILPDERRVGATNEPERSLLHWLVNGCASHPGK
jgi:hypothetical protein